MGRGKRAVARSHGGTVSALTAFSVLLILIAVSAPRAVRGYAATVRLAQRTTAASDVVNAATSLSLYEVTADDSTDLQLRVNGNTALRDGGTLVVSPGNTLDVIMRGHRFCVHGNDANGSSIYWDSGLGRLTDAPLGLTCGA